MPSNMIVKTLKVGNMTCVNCENKIERVMSKEEGIINVTASYSAGTVTITYDDSRISISRIEELLENEDYHVIQEQSVNVNGIDTGKENGSDAKQQKPEKVRDYSDIVGIAVIVFAFYMMARRFGLLNIFYNFPVAKDGMGYGMLLIIGLLTSVHCVAMCGGICLSQCVPKDSAAGAFTNRFSAIRPSLLYNVGRVISYTIIGGIVGAIGSIISFSGPMQGIVQILAGVFMVIMGINMLGIFPWLRRFNPRMPKIFAKKIYSHSNSRSPLYIGLLNGLMPCGPLQAMQLYALSTGSPLKGALSMFIFSIGTVPLLFAFGAISSFLNKKFTNKMMTVSAVLVVVLGIFMFNNGISLSGIAFPNITAASSSTKSATSATLKDGVQVVTTGISSGKYEPIVVQKGIPVQWTIQAESGDLNGCNNRIIVQKYGIEKSLQTGDNVIEFTPSESGTIPFSCWMGMIRSKIVVVDDLNNVDSNAIIDDSTQSAGGSCCAGGSGTSSSSGNGINFDFSKLEGKKISTDKLAVAEEKDNIQSVTIKYDENGFSPAVIVVQSGLETEWIINGSKMDSSKSTLLFPNYSAQLELVEGENPITFIPSQDFDFFTSDGSYLGYVKVVEDINQIDTAAIKKEVSEYNISEKYKDQL